MFSIDAEFLTLLRSAMNEPSLELHLQEDWGSQEFEHRAKIHQAVAALRPTSHSISHTMGLGGFAITNSTHQIGFDIELFDRVTEVVAKRVCLIPAEFDRAPSPAHLWVAKEAAFKALRGKDQPAVISEIELGAWTKLASQIETFQVLNPANPMKMAKTAPIGVVFRKNQFIFSVFLLVPAFPP